jgi:hypothetical protein
MPNPVEYLLGNYMILDRDRQRQILRALADAYPDHVKTFLDWDHEKADYANLIYLEEHGLVNAGITRTLDGGYAFNGARVTAKGLDFLEDDGGLSAILGTVVVKLHSDTIRELLQQRIANSDLPHDKKFWLQDQIKRLSNEALSEIAKQLVHRGIEHIPDLYKWVRTFVPPVS